MIAWWMAQLALLGALLAVAASGAEAALQVARRPSRWVWVAALGMTVALGASAPRRLGSGERMERVWQSMAPVSGSAATIVSRDALTFMRAVWRDASVLVDVQAQRAWSTWHSTMPAGIEQWLLFTWTATSVALLSAFGAVHWRYQRRRARWPLGVMHGTTVRIAEDTGPAVIGLANTEIVVPSWLLSRDDREQQMVLAHELEHVRQHDPLLLALAQAAVILLPWHPAVWWMAARLRLSVELDCDRRVLQRGASARDYGTLLIDLTGHRTGFGAALPAFSCRPSHLERRLVAMTPRHLKYPLIRAIATGAMASLALLAACEAKLPTSDEVDRMTAASAAQAAGRVALIDTANVTYFIDGTPLSKADADKIAAERIASVNVLQKGTLSGGEVRIVTRIVAPGDSTNPTRINFVRTDPTRVTFVTPGDTVTFMALGATSDIAVKRAAASKPRTGFTGLMIVDGVITDPAVANRIAPDQIASVDVIKGAAASSQYSDPRAVNGVIKIVTKSAKR